MDKSISNGAQYVTPVIIFFSSKFSYVLFSATPTHKTETGTANRWRITNNKPPGPIIMMGHSKKH
jgi:hypothetical protein